MDDNCVIIIVSGMVQKAGGLSNEGVEGDAAAELKNPGHRPGFFRQLKVAGEKPLGIAAPGFPLAIPPCRFLAFST
jgi:hypothetical protein